MTNMKQIFLLAMASAFLALSAKAQQVAVDIPLNTFLKPPTDLVNAEGKPMTSDDIVKAFNQTKDVSNFDPIENNIWQKKRFDAVYVKRVADMPKDDDTVVYDADQFASATRILGLYSATVSPLKKPEQKFGINFGLTVHASMLRAALLRKLGYFQQSPRYYKQLKMKFKDAKQMHLFIEKAFCPKDITEANIDCLFLDPIERKFITDINEEAATLNVHGAYLEYKDPQVKTLFDGLSPAPLGPNSFEGTRAYRALIIPFVLADLQESINRYSVQVCAVQGGRVAINYFDGDYFKTTDHFDVKWILFQMAKLTDTDWEDIAKASGLPSSLQELVEVKLKYRFKNLMGCFLSKEEVKNNYKLNILPKLSTINSADGYVKNGVVTQEMIPGYPQRFSHGPRQSPFESGDFLRYLKVKTQSTAIDWVVGEMTKKINEKNFPIKVLDQKINGVEVGPKGVRPLVTARYLQGGIQADASRLITTGTFYGSASPVQMVDTITVGAAIGYGRFAEALSGITTQAGANISYVRNFTHVRPVTRMKDAAKVDFDELLTKIKISQIAAPLKNGKISEFLKGLQDGEVFTITDSISTTAQVSWTTGIDALIQLGSIARPTIGISADASGVVLRQIQFTRTDRGLQVFVRNNNQKMFGLGLDLNYFINLLKIRAETKKSDYQTSAFVIDLDVEKIAQVEVLASALAQEEAGEVTGIVISDEDKEKIKENQKMITILKALILRSNVDPLFQKGAALEQRLTDINQYEIQHELKTKEVRTKLLWFRAARLKEQHVLRIRKEGLPPTVNGVAINNQDIEIVTNRKGEMVGRDKFGFALNLLDGFLKELSPNAPALATNVDNPSTMPFGKAQWRMIRTDSEITSPARTGQLPTVASIEHVWGGWSLKPGELNAILDLVKKEADQVNSGQGPLFPAQSLYQVKKVDFFKIVSRLALLPSAIQRIKQLMAVEEINQIAPAVETSGEQPEIAIEKKVKMKNHILTRIKNIFKTSKRKEDQVVYKKILELSGDGSSTAGLEECKAEVQQKQNAIGDGGQYMNTTGAYYKGQSYECLDSWMLKLIKLSRSFPKNNLKKQNEWMTEVLFVLDEKIPQAFFLNYLGKEQFVYYVSVTGFRSGDEDGDDGEVLSQIYGTPHAKDAAYANGLISIIGLKSGILPIELDRSEGSFQ